MGLYTLIFLNSFKSSLVVSLSSENAWFAALHFGGHNMWLATFMAVAGSSMGIYSNFLLGSYLAWKRDDWLALSETTYLRLSGYTRYTIYLLLFPLSAVPGLGIFWGLYVLVIGFFRAPLLKSALLIMLGRAAYYSFYLVYP